MKKIRNVIAIFLLAALTMSMSSCATRIKAGYEGLKVALAGGDKGTTKIEPCYGLILY